MKDYKEYTEQLLELIKTSRKEKKISQAFISEKLGISQNTYKNIETGQSQIKFEMALQILDILEIDLSQIGKEKEETSIAIREMEFHNFLKFYLDDRVNSQNEIKALNDKLDTLIDLFKNNKEKEE